MSNKKKKLLQWKGFFFAFCLILSDDLMAFIISLFFLVQRLSPFFNDEQPRKESLQNRLKGLKLCDEKPKSLWWRKIIFYAFFEKLLCVCVFEDEVRVMNE